MTLPATTEDSIAAAVAAALAARETLRVEGNGTKSGLMRPVRAARSLSTAGLSGITLYAPKELIISARAGTPMPEIEATLAEAGQYMIAEPPDLSAVLGSNDKPQTLGGVVATNLSGPRRIARGAIRDHVMGIRAINGRAELIRSGGRVLKNVTGLDLCKLFTGSYGTLGVLTEITLKVLPAPEATGTLVLPGLDAAAGIAAMSAALGSPFDVSAAAWLPAEAVAATPALDGVSGPAALIRIEEFADSVTYRIGRLRDQFALPGAVTLGTEASRSVWRDIRDVRPLAPRAEDAVWRVSVRPSAGAGILGALRPHGAAGFLDWGGGLVWLAGPADAATHLRVEAAARAAGGTWTLLRAPDALRAAVRVIPDEPPPLARITREVKAAMDPAGIFNPGRLYADV
jgi:glycolate oxidase FAD binding subunit